MIKCIFFFFFFFNDTATTEIYTLSLHDALPISVLTLEAASGPGDRKCPQNPTVLGPWDTISGDRKSTRLNSSHSQISYAVFCLKKKKKKNKHIKEPQKTHKNLPEPQQLQHTT